MSRFTDAKSWERCQWTITLSDKTTAQCGRRKRPDGPFCTQHENIAAEQRGAVNPRDVTPTSQYHVTGINPQPDLTVQHDGGHGSIYLLRDHTDAGRDWLLEHVASDDNITFGDAIVVEHRYIQDIIDGARADGLTVGPA